MVLGKQIWRVFCEVCRASLQTGTGAAREPSSPGVLSLSTQPSLPLPSLPDNPPLSRPAPASVPVSRWERESSEKVRDSLVTRSYFARDGSYAVFASTSTYSGRLLAWPSVQAASYQKEELCGRRGAVKQGKNWSEREKHRPRETDLPPLSTSLLRTSTRGSIIDQIRKFLRILHVIFII